MCMHACKCKCIRKPEIKVYLIHKCLTKQLITNASCQLRWLILNEKKS